MSSLRRIPFALAALFVVVGLIAVCAYVISAWQVFGFAEHVWRLPLELCFGAAFVADLLSLAGLFATYLLRRASRPVQAYAWFVFLGMTGLSIAAAESYASWRFADPHDRPDVTFDARIASGAVVVALALAVHLLIICRNHIPVRSDGQPTTPVKSKSEPIPAVVEQQAEPRRRWWNRTPAVEFEQKRELPPAPPAPARAATPAQPAVVIERAAAHTPSSVTSTNPPAPVTAPATPPPTPRPATTRPAPDAPAGDRAEKKAAEQARRDRLAADIIAERTTTKDVATAERVSDRAVQMWVKAYRERNTGAAARPDLKTPMLGPQHATDQREHPATDRIEVTA